MRLNKIQKMVLFFSTSLTFIGCDRVSTLQMLSFGSIIAGGVGNIIDRLIHDRHVPDFLNVGINDVRTGIFNVADICVTAGVISLLVSYYFFKSEDSVATETERMTE